MGCNFWNNLFARSNGDGGVLIGVVAPLGNNNGWQNCQQNEGS